MFFLDEKQSCKVDLLNITECFFFFLDEKQSCKLDLLNIT